MLLIKVIKKSKSLRTIAIIFIFGWLFLFGFTYMIYTSSINNTIEYEENELITHYEDIFDSYTTKMDLISSYFTEYTIILTDSEYEDFMETLVEDCPTINSITFAPAGVIHYVYPSSMYEDLHGYDIIGNSDVYESSQLTEAMINQTILYQYEIVDDEVAFIYIRNPIYIDDEFYGFITMTIDSSVFATAAFTYTSEVIDSALFTETGTLIYGKEDIDEYELIDIESDEITITLAHKIKTDFLLSNLSYRVGLVLSIGLVFSIVFLIVFRDKIKLNKLVEELHYRKNYDSETDLYNIDKLYKDVKDLMEVKEEFYLAFLNINNVKYINEKFGHISTNELLKKTTGMIDRVLRNNSTLYRYGGDEYVIVTKTDSVSEEKNLLRRVIKIFESDIVSGSIRTRLAIQVGVSQFPQNGYTVETLIKNAHITASQVSNYDKEGFMFYRQDKVTNQMANEDFDKMVSGLNLELFEVHIMPIVNVDSNQIAGFECLTRTYNDLGKQLDTEEVVLSLERNGRIQELDEIVFKKMLSIMKRLNKEFPKQDYFLSVNASALSLNDEYVDNVINYYKSAKLKKGQIVLELTESYQVDDYDYLIQLFNRLIAEGIKVAIDDFGSGYSSISYIAKFPIYAIKIDKEYVRDYGENKFNQTLMMTLKSIAEVLDCRLIAEGVDSQDTLQYLKDVQCPYYQGYLFSKGVTFEDAVALINNNLSLLKTEE